MNFDEALRLVEVDAEVEIECTDETIYHGELAAALTDWDDEPSSVVVLQPGRAVEIDWRDIRDIRIRQR